MSASHELYYSRKTCASVPHVALEESGAGFELVSLDFGRQEQKPAELRQIDPLARVPAGDGPRTTVGGG